jgi:protein-S-isoprenylcysteine O-methyltransferase Ste14
MGEKPELGRMIVRRMVQIGVMILLQAAILFAVAGDLAWVAAWVYLGVYVGLIGVNALILLPTHPEIVAERAQAGPGVKGWDKVIGVFYGLFSLSILIVASLAHRFAWPPASGPVAVGIGLALYVLGFALFSWAMASNPFFSTLVRIQDERGHAVAAGGPYRFVRHPGYVGGLASGLGTALLLGSPWALIPAALLACTLVIRTALEDRTLRAELPGYAEYAQQTRYRLLPGVW